MPCYNRDADSLSCTIQAPLRPFKQEQIIVVENANAAHRRTGTRQANQDIDPAICCIWSPMGSKALTQYVGSLAARKYHYIVTTNDDVGLPDNFVAPRHLPGDKVIGVCLPVSAINA